MSRDITLEMTLREVSDADEADIDFPGFGTRIELTDGYIVEVDEFHLYSGE